MKDKFQSVIIGKYHASSGYEIYKIKKKTQLVWISFLLGAKDYIGIHMLFITYSSCMHSKLIMRIGV